MMAEPEVTSDQAVGVTFDDQDFKRSLQYKSSATAESVVSDMAHLRQFDGEQEKQIQIWTAVGALGIGVVIIGGICLFSGSTTPGIVLAVIGLVMAIAGFSIKAIRGRLNLDDRRYELVAGLLKLLSKDMPSEAPVDVSLDFRAHNDADKFLRNGKVSYWNVKYFVDRWLEMRGRFIDGTKYSVTVIEKQQDRSRTKRSASGKIKHKSKVKNCSEAIITLRIKEKRYPNAKELYRELNKTLQLPPWVELKSIKAEGDLLTMRATTSNRWEATGPGESPAKLDGVHWLAMMFLSLYRLLNGSK